MATLTLTPAEIKATLQRCAAACRPNPVAALSNDEVVRGKWMFLTVARLECEDFQVRHEQRRALDALCRWGMMDGGGPLDPHKGLWLWGNIGSGKSTLLRIVRRFTRAVRPPNAAGWLYSFGYFHASEICAAFQRSGYEGLEQYVKSSRLGIDDLGTEMLSAGHYGDNLNVIAYLLQRRYDRRSGATTHVTTNLAPDEIADRYGQRVWDRCKEMFNFVELPGRTFRQPPPSL